MDKTRKANLDNLNAWLEKNATQRFTVDGWRVYEIRNRRQQPFTAVAPDGYVVGFYATSLFLIPRDWRNSHRKGLGAAAAATG